MNIKIDKDGIWVSQATKDGYIFCEWGGALMHHYLTARQEEGESRSEAQYVLHSPVVDPIILWW